MRNYFHHTALADKGTSTNTLSHLFYYIQTSGGVHSITTPVSVGDTMNYIAFLLFCNLQVIISDRTKADRAF